jgi:signal transduction histidine kinase
VTIAARHNPSAERIEFKIVDTGIGIPRENIQTIFDMFEQVDSSASRKFSGVGLGLYIVKKFTQLLGGSVTVTSELGIGSVFTVTLPLNHRESERAMREPQSRPHTTSLH